MTDLEMRYADHPSIEAYRSLAKHKGVELRTVLEHAETGDLTPLFHRSSNSVPNRRRALLLRRMSY